MAESGEAALGRFPGRSLCLVLVRPWSSSAPGPAQPLGAADAAHPQAAAFPVKNPTNNLPPCRMKQELEFFLISTKQPANPGMQSSFSTRTATQPRHDFQVRSSLMGWCMTGRFGKLWRTRLLSLRWAQSTPSVFWDCLGQGGCAVVPVRGCKCKPSLLFSGKSNVGHKEAALLLAPSLFC